MTGEQNFDDGRAVGYREALVDVAGLLLEQGQLEWAEQLRRAAEVFRATGVSMPEQEPWR